MVFKNCDISKTNEDSLLQLSGIQHIAFCRRQYALAYVEQQWNDNKLTVEGRHLHENVDDPFYKNILKGKVFWRSVLLVSHQLGLIGRADVVEFNKSDEGIKLEGRKGKWVPYPIEYKRGRPKNNDIDEVQLCAQAICLEEMFNVSIQEGAIYYGLIKRRTVVHFTNALRERVVYLVNEMHHINSVGITPEPAYATHCKSCSLFDICLPKVLSNSKSAKEYLKSNLL
ncbi:MAG: CRISPR-associated protein Cas4 [Acinetobacter sp.]|uniref:CRISPR-associated protein Cas4 n=1 Tax=Acinetobacter sp. TaxID=472 RepID=UPI002591242D|nr:CRISPR-associated protein Cas4 [Acinetobacter sp.]MCE1271875.1 CRISPR-associated protein Cas4 [Acinetobacter sp.]